MQALNFTNLDSVELRQYIADNDENNYTVIDVRQPEEYEISHIPGSTLIPLPTLIQDNSPLPKSGELIFMCRSGARSRAASIFASSVVPDDQKVYNLSGGIMDWFGKTLEGRPGVQLLGDYTNFNSVIMSAMNLEKGAFNFYKAILEKFPDESFTNSMEFLSLAEEEHAKALYRILEKRNGRLDQTFGELFSSLKGDIMEGGMSLDSAMDHLNSIEEDRAVHTLDLCIDIEFSAFDLYKNAARIIDDPEIKKILQDIANGEKNHMKKLADSFTMID